MTLADVLGTALSALASNLLRTLLTMLGIIIGIAAVITLTAASEGAQQGVSEQISGLGSNLIFVRPGTAESGGIQLPGQGVSLFLEDSRAIEAANFEYIEAIAVQGTVGGPGDFIQASAIYLGQNKSTLLLATEPSYQFVRDFYVENGRIINEELQMTIAFVTHEKDVAAYTRRIVSLRDGKVVGDRPNVPVYAGQLAAEEAGP